MRREKKSEPSVTLEVCRRRVILLCVGGNVMDTSVAAEGDPLRNPPQSAAHFIYTRRGCCTFPLNLIIDTSFPPLSILLFIFLMLGEYTRNDFPMRKVSNRHRQVYCIGCGPSHFCSKSNEISQMTQAIQICETISYARESASLLYRRNCALGLRCSSCKPSRRKIKFSSLVIRDQKGQFWCYEKWIF